MAKWSYRFIFLSASLVGLLLFSSTLLAADCTVETKKWLVPDGQLTLRQARSTALDNSPSVSEAVARIHEASALIQRTESSLWPRISLRSSYRYSDGVQQLDWAPDQRLHDSFVESSAGLHASWLVFDGFQRRANILAAQYQAEQAQQLLTETHRLLLQAVSTAYFQAQLALEEMVIAQENRQFNRVLEDESRKRWQAGAIAESEMLNFSVRALQAESDFLDAEQRFDVSCAILIQLMAVDADPEQMSYLPQRAMDDLQTGHCLEFRDELNYALLHRPDLKAIDAQISTARQQQKSVKGSYLPQLQLVAGTDITKQQDLGNTDQDEHGSYAGLELNWELFSGGERAAHIRQIDHQLNQLQASRQQLVQEIRSLLRQSLTKSSAAQRILDKQLHAYTLTVKIRHHIEQSYRAGVATLTRLNEAQTDLVNASGRVALSRINYLLAEQQVLTESGRLLTVQ